MSACDIAGFGCHIVTVGVNADLLQCISFFAGQGVKFSDALQLFAKEGQPPCAVIQVGRKDFERIAAHPEAPAKEGGIVAFVLLGYQIGNDLPLVINAA